MYVRCQYLSAVKLGVLSPKGQAALAQEALAAEIFRSHNPDLTYITTPKDKPSRIDGVLVDGFGTIRAVVECKSRYGISLENFRTRFRNEWLITFEKMTSGAKVAELFHVPLVGFLYLVESGTLLTIQLADQWGHFSQPFRVEKTETTKDINGGKTIRNNAFVRMEAARLYTAKVTDTPIPRVYPWEQSTPKGKQDAF